MKKAKLIIFIIIVIPVFAAIIYASWYSYERQVKIVKAEECMNQKGGPGKVLQICSTIIPPSIWNLARGQIVVEGLPNKMVLAPYSLKDVLLGNYKATLTVGMLTRCDQSATTTDCSKLSSLPQTESKPYVPPSVSQSTYTMVSATNTPMIIAGYSLILPPGWKIEAYSGFAGWHVLFQKGDTPGFTMECPPSGKGFEAATITEKEERVFTHGDVKYKLIFESLSQSKGDPWYFLFIQAAQNGGEFYTECTAQGSITPDITEAMQMIYDTLSIE